MTVAKAAPDAQVEPARELGVEGDDDGGQADER
jgi:hypothetical protein